MRDAHRASTGDPGPNTKQILDAANPNNTDSKVLLAYSLSARSRKYTLTLSILVKNALNIVNLGTPSEVLDPSAFGRFRTIAGGQLGNWLPGNCTIMFVLNFNI